jgi:predicted nucleic acid-binding protein
MSGKPFFDTNILIYALHSGDDRSRKAHSLLADGGIISVQSLNEFVSVARRKLKLRWKEVYEAIAAIETLCPSPRAITIDTHKRALGIADRYGYSIFDGLILAAALEANSTTLYSEDLQHGQKVEGLTIRNPFSSGS